MERTFVERAVGSKLVLVSALALAVLAAIALVGSGVSEGGVGSVVVFQEERGAQGARGRNQEHASPGKSDGRVDFPPEGGVGTPGAKVHFTVMHVVNPRSPAEHAGQPSGDSSEPHHHTSSANTIFELMRHADSMLHNDNEQLSQEAKRIADSKPKGLYNSIEAAKKKSDRLDREAVDHKVDAGFKTQEAERENQRSTLEKRRGDVAEALAHEFQAKIEQHKKELAADKYRAAEVKTEETARAMREKAAEDKDRALRDARLAGELDDKADRTSIEARRVRQEENQSLLQLRQLNDEVKRAEEEAKRAREDAHKLRADAGKDVKVATASLASAARLIKKARKARHKARVKQTELSEARLALKAAAKVETSLTVQAASYSGKAKLDILQSKLLTKAASTHKGSADKLKHDEEQVDESLERLQEKKEHARVQRHEAEVRMRRVQDRLDLEKRRAKRRLERARVAADRAQDRYKTAETKYQDSQSLTAAGDDA